jgi:DHA2 family multidrug resistance protein
MQHPISNKMIVALLSVIFLITFNFTFTNIASTYISGALGSSTDLASYTISYFAYGNVVGIPLVRPLSHRYGDSRCLSGLLTLFLIVSTLCSLSNSYYQVVIFRFLQGFVSGPLIPLVAHIIASAHEKKATFLSSYGVILLSIITPTVGSSIGGIVAYEYEWSWNFHFNIPILLILIPYFHFSLKNANIPKLEPSFNIVGYIFFSLWVLCFGSVITLGQFLDWHRSNIILSLFFIGMFSVIAHYLWDRKNPHAVLKLHLLLRYTLSFSLLCLSVLFASYFGMVLLLGLWLTLDVKFTPYWIALILGHMMIAVVILAFFIDKLLKLDPRIPLSIALAFMAISCFYTSNFAMEIDFFRIAISRVLAGIGLALFFAPIVKMSSMEATADDAVDSNVLVQVTRCLSSGIGAAAFTTMWWRRSVFYHERLGEQLTPFSQQLKYYYQKIKDFEIPKKETYPELNKLLDQQSKALALDDTFYFMGWLLLIMFFCVVMSFIKKKELAAEAKT